MPIPAGVEQVTVSDGGVPLTGPDGTPLEGQFTVTGPELATVREDDFLFSGFARRWVTAGRFDPLTLVATDATDIDPTGFSYTVVFTPKRGTAWTRYFTLPKASPSVVLADILIPDPVTGTPTSGSGGSPTGSAGGDLSGTYPNPTVAKVNGVAVTGAPTAGQVPTALSPTAASWQTPATPPSPASTVTAETSYGQASQAGSASAYARGDHTHGTPALPTPAAIGAEPVGTAAATVNTHTAATDPHSDRAYTDTQVATRLPASGGVISGNLAVTGHALGEDTPAARGLAGWCYNPALAVNSTQLVNGTLYLVRVNIAAAVNVTKLYWWIGNQGSSPVAGQNQVGLYNSAGTLLASATVDSDISTAGLKPTTITSQALTAGSWYWVGLLFNASVAPTLTRGSGWTGVEAAANAGLSASAFQYARNGTGRTALPASITPASNIGTDFAGPWVAAGP